MKSSSIVLQPREVFEWSSYGELLQYRDTAALYGRLSYAESIFPEGPISMTRFIMAVSYDS